jgi:hypothetical protein
MTVEEVKKELRQMDAPGLRELSTFILQLRRSQDPDRKRKVSQTLDSPDSKWLTLDEMDRQLGDG